MRKLCISPELVARSYVPPQRSRATAVHQTDDAVAVDGRRNGLTEAHVLKPRLFSCDVRKVLRGDIVQVEKKKIVFHARPQVAHAIALGGLLFFEDGKIVGAEAAE